MQKKKIDNNEILKKVKERALQNCKGKLILFGSKFVLIKCSTEYAHVPTFYNFASLIHSI